VNSLRAQPSTFMAEIWNKKNEGVREETVSSQRADRSQSLLAEQHKLKLLYRCMEAAAAR